MAEKNLSTTELIERSKKIALCTADVNSDEICNTLLLLAKYLTGRSKEVGVYSVGVIDQKLSDKIEQEGFKVEQTLQAVSYVISIDYGKNGIEKISYDPDEKTGKLNFYITPTNGDFDFNNIEYRTEGNDYDLVITIGIESFKDLGELYEKNRKLFSASDVISIIKGETTLGDQTIHVDLDQSFLLGVKQLVGNELNGELAGLMADALLSDVETLDMIGEPAILEQMIELGKAGVDLGELLNKKFFNKSYSNLDLQIKLMHNVTVDRESRVIWSKLDREDLKFCGISKENIDLTGRIIFNITGEFDLVFAIYEVDKDELHVVVESNDLSKYDASKIAGVFGGSGSESHATFTIKNMPIKGFEKNVFMVLTDMYGLKIRGKGMEFKATVDVSDDKGVITPPTIGGVER